jgi:hypothetical protein
VAIESEKGMMYVCRPLRGGLGRVTGGMKEPETACPETDNSIPSKDVRIQE